MSTLTVSASQKKALTIATIIALVGGAYFLRPYFSLIALAAIVAFMFNPVYQRFERRWNNPNRSSMVTLIVALLVLIIPVVGVIGFSIKQVDWLADSFDSTVATEYITTGIDGVNNFLSSINVDASINQESITNAIQNQLVNFGQNVIKDLPSFFGSFFGFFSTSIIFLFVFLSILKNQKTLVRTIYSLNPLGNQVSKLYIDKTAAMTKAMVRGQFIIATAQGFTDAALLALAGLPNLFFFFFVFLTALSIIPLGGGIVAIPIGIIMALTGNVWGGVLVVAGHILIVTNIDNVLRPRLVPKEAKLDSALTLLSVFAGLKAFGFLGIVLGPVIMILIVTTIQVYQEVHGHSVMLDAKDQARGIIAKTSRKLRKLIGKENKAKS